jgi:hypothetical protein
MHTICTKKDTLLQCTIWRVCRGRRGSVLKRNDNNNDKKKALILFQAKGEYGNSISDQFKQNRKVYHLAQRFSAESFSVCALCQKVYYLNWGIPFDFVFLPNELDSLANKLLCRHCMLEAMTLIAELERAEQELQKERNKREDYKMEILLCYHDECD